MKFPFRASLTRSCFSFGSVTQQPETTPAISAAFPPFRPLMGKISSANGVEKQLPTDPVYGRMYNEQEYDSLNKSRYSQHS